MWLADEGHRVAAMDLSLDADDGLRAAERVSPSAAMLLRAEAEMEALPVEPASFDLVLAADSLHYAPRLARTLVELRRATRREGMLVVLDSPVYRRREDGEAVVAERMRAQARRYGVPMDRDRQPGYLVAGELPGLFRSAGWSLEIHGWPGWARERTRDAVDLLRHRRCTARFPILCARRDG
jgi:SAM-dependent methyltransferase